MRYGNRSVWKRIASSSLALVGFIALSIIVARATWSMLDKSSASALKLSQVQTELDKLKSREESLSSQISRLSTEQGIEAELRTKFHAVKDGESVVVILESPQASSSSAQSAAVVAASATKMGWWQRVLRAIGL